MAFKKEVVEIIEPKDVFVGNIDAPVTLEEFGEYESEICAKANEVVKQLLEEYDGKIRFFSNDILMNLEPMHEMFIPVNKVGNQNKNHATMMQDLYESENNLLTYPAGMCSRKINGKIIDPEWKKNFITKSIEYQRDVVPIYFEGRNSNFFYNLANIRKFFRIKLNVEMMYLVNEMFKKKGGHFVIRIGEPIPWQTFDKTKSQTEWAAWVKEIVYKMEKK